jgi:hypothetical protein
MTPDAEGGSWVKTYNSPANRAGHYALKGFPMQTKGMPLGNRVRDRTKPNGEPGAGKA